MNNENFDLELNNDVENFNLTPNDEDEEFTVEFGEVINDGGTYDYNELDNKPQINGNTLEGNKTNEQLGIPVYTEGTGIKLSGNTISADTDVLATKAELNSKQNVIADLPQIRSGAEAGATAVQPEDLARIATTGSYNDSLDKPSINNVALTGNKSLDALGIQPKGDYALESEIPDVSNFITNTVDNLVNYYLKSETFTKQEVNNLISAITTMDIRVVQTLPTEDISTTTIYLVPKATAGTNDAYDEYIYVSNAWEHIGSTEVDLTNYVQKTDYATTTTAGVMSATDKVKLNNVSGYYGTCATGAGTSAKVVTCDNFVLEEGAVIYVNFTNAQTYNGTATLNVNNTGAKDIVRVESNKITRYFWRPGEIVGFIYDGTNYVMIEGGNATTTYYGVTKLFTGANSDSLEMALTPRSLYYLGNNSIAPYYSSSDTYAVGDKVRYGYYLYQCITAINTPESWDADHWTALPTIQEQVDNKIWYGTEQQYDDLTEINPDVLYCIVES